MKLEDVNVGDIIYWKDQFGTWHWSKVRVINSYDDIVESDINIYPYKIKITGHDLEGCLTIDEYAKLSTVTSVDDPFETTSELSAKKDWLSRLIKIKSLVKNVSYPVHMVFEGLKIPVESAEIQSEQVNLMFKYKQWINEQIPIIEAKIRELEKEVAATTENAIDWYKDYYCHKIDLIRKRPEIKISDLPRCLKEQWDALLANKDVNLNLPFDLKINPCQYNFKVTDFETALGSFRVVVEFKSKFTNESIKLYFINDHCQGYGTIGG